MNSTAFGSSLQGGLEREQIRAGGMMRSRPDDSNSVKMPVDNAESKLERALSGFKPV